MKKGNCGGLWFATNILHHIRKSIFHFNGSLFYSICLYYKCFFVQFILIRILISNIFDKLLLIFNVWIKSSFMKYYTCSFVHSFLFFSFLEDDFHLFFFEISALWPFTLEKFALNIHSIAIAGPCVWMNEWLDRPTNSTGHNNTQKHN